MQVKDMAKLWHRAAAQVLPGSEMEVFLGLDRFCEDKRVVEFSHRSGEYLLPTWTTPYDPYQEPEVLGEFVATFAPPRSPSDSEIADFYARFGPLGDREWQERLSEEDRRQLPEPARLGLREPVWWLQERAAELELCCLLYWGLADHRLEVLRAALGSAPPQGCWCR